MDTSLVDANRTLPRELLARSPELHTSADGSLHILIDHSADISSIQFEHGIVLDVDRLKRNIVEITLIDYDRWALASIPALRELWDSYLQTQSIGDEAESLEAATSFCHFVLCAAIPELTESTVGLYRALDETPLRQPKNRVSELTALLERVLAEPKWLQRLVPKPSGRLPAWQAVRRRKSGRGHTREIKLILDDGTALEATLEDHFVLLPEGHLKALVRVRDSLTMRRGHYSIVLTNDGPVEITSGTFYDAAIVVDQPVSDWESLPNELSTRMRSLREAIVLDDVVQIRVTPIRTGDLVQPAAIGELGGDLVRLLDDQNESAAELRVSLEGQLLSIQLVAGQAWFADGSSLTTGTHRFPGGGLAELRARLRIRAP